MSKDTQGKLMLAGVTVILAGCGVVSFVHGLAPEAGLFISFSLVPLLVWFELDNWK